MQDTKAMLNKPFITVSYGFGNKSFIGHSEDNRHTAGLGDNLFVTAVSYTRKTFITLYGRNLHYWSL